ncbi:24607_t:CDS:2 [Dentiscutata erythropus]|uniref:24607_t:CDS:1 n=1 Tax=Dentiscutata erythropus TaxID=1348616 RepID=A0A9N9ECJ6_9GLOM|nr:24607_t:CDS:2 [Dentiscutata erythropus]
MSDSPKEIEIGYKCVLCRHQGKKCQHDEEMLGIYKCKKCERQKIDCLVQCNECYKKNIPFSKECRNCKVVIEVQPIKGSFVGEDGRIYFQTSDGTIKVEVEQEGLEDLLKLLQNKNNIPDIYYPNVNFYGLDSSSLYELPVEDYDTDSFSYKPPGEDSVSAQPFFYEFSDGNFVFVTPFFFYEFSDGNLVYVTPFFFYEF